MRPPLGIEEVGELEPGDGDAGWSRPVVAVGRSIAVSNTTFGITLPGVVLPRFRGVQPRFSVG